MVSLVLMIARWLDILAVVAVPVACDKIVCTGRQWLPSDSLMPFFGDALEMLHR